MELVSDVMKTALGADTELEEKGPKKWEIDNITLNDTSQLAKLCMSTDTKSGLLPKGHNLMDCNRLPL